MLIKGIRIRNFKSIIDTGYFEIKSLNTILLGKNESGKSSILEAFKVFEEEKSNFDDLNIELILNNNKKTQKIEITYELKKDIFENFKLFLLWQLSWDKKTLKTEDIFGFDFKLIEYTIEKSFIFNDEDSSLIFKKTLDKKTIDSIKKQMFKNLEKTYAEKPDLLVDYIFNKPFNKYAVMQFGAAFEKMKKEIKLFFSNDKVSELLADFFWKNGPKIFFFNRETKFFPPNEITLNEILKNKKKYPALIFIEKILERKFEEFNTISEFLVEDKASIFSDKLTDLFNKDWKQESNNPLKEIGFKITNFKKIDNTTMFKFYFRNKKNHSLKFEQKSDGLKLYFSFWLLLKAHQKENHVFIFDEPGNHLHPGACKDLRIFFKKIMDGGSQIIFATHSPYMFDEKEIANISLVFNDLDKGTQIEKITSTKFDSAERKEAFKPIFDAIGYSPFGSLGLIKEKNVLLEGISDFYYFDAMKKILKKDEKDYHFVPGKGADERNISPLISFCIGYKVEWLVILDNDESGRTAKKDLIEKFQLNSEESSIFLLDGFNKIEDMFQENELKKITNLISNNKMERSQMFNLKIRNNEILKKDINPKTIKNFELIFEKIEKFFTKKK